MISVSSVFYADVSFVPRRRVARPPGRFRLHALETETRQVQFIDESVDHPDRIVQLNITIMVGRQKADLTTINSFDKTSHSAPPKQCRVLT
jgi:hypothetical protein